MMQPKQVHSIVELNELKRLYVSRTTAPLDGMWLDGFVPQATHFGLYENETDDTLGGYYCVNDEGYLLQFVVNAKHEGEAAGVFASITREASSSVAIKGAFVSTAEPSLLSLCLDRFNSFEVNTLMYQLGTKADESSEPALSLQTVDATQKSEAVAVAAIGAPEEWLKGYYAKLIEREELFGLWKNGQLVSLGETRCSEHFQTQHVDLGVIVCESKRGKGIATQMLKALSSMSRAKGLNPICSTESGNHAAQRAISRAGFIAHNRIVRFTD